MVSERLRYVTRRQNRSGGSRWYWQRPGFPMRRLANNPVERFAEAFRLNAAADGGGEIVDGTVGWAIGKYRLSDRYCRLAPSTHRTYERWLGHFEKTIGDRPLAQISRRVVMEIRDRLRDKPATQRHALAVLALIFKQGRNYGVIDANPVVELELSRPAPRRQVWQPHEIEAFLQACDDPGVKLAFQILRYSAQRPGDVCAMTWAQYDGEVIRLRQQKTGVLLDVPCHADLRTILNVAPRRGTVICTTRTGRPLTRRRLTELVQRIREKAGLDHLQLRDLRRTAVVNMAEAGAEVPQIAAVTGHSIDRTANILSVYLPTNLRMATAAIHKLERNK